MLIDRFAIVDDDVATPLRKALAGFGGQFDHAQLGAPPLAAYGRSVAAIVEEGHRVMDALDAFESRSPIIGAPEPERDPDLLMRSYRDLTYRLWEHYDFLAEIPKAIVSIKSAKVARNLFNTRLQRCKRTASIICNKLKHNHNQLVYVRNYLLPSRVTVHGFSMFEYAPDGSMRPNKELYPGGSESTSFNLALKANLSDFLASDRAGAALCDHIGGASPDLGPRPTKGRSLLDLLRRVARRPEIGFAKERAQKIDTVRIERAAVTFGRQERPVPPQSEARVDVRLTIMGDGVTRSFKMIEWPEGQRWLTPTALLKAR